MPTQTALHTESINRQHGSVISAQIVLSEITCFFTWWYVEMPTWYIGFFQRVATLCDDTFSISLLFKTFFIPWHRDTSIVGRGFGIAMRMIYLPLALLVTAIILFILAAATILWAILPIISMFFLLRTPLT